MPRRISFILGIVLLALPLSSFAAYVIHLKDGTKFVTDEYFEEDEQVKFKRYGGLFGIKKDRIRAIEEMEAPPEPPEKKETHAETTAPPPAVGKEGSKAEAPESQGAAEEENKASGQTEIKEKQAQGLTDEQKKLADKYLKDFDDYKEKFRNVNLMSVEDLNEFYNQLNTLRKTVLKKRLVSFFQNEILEIHSMLDKIQEVMKFKGS